MLDWRSCQICYPLEIMLLLLLLLSFPASVRFLAQLKKSPVKKYSHQNDLAAYLMLCIKVFLFYLKNGFKIFKAFWNMASKYLRLARAPKKRKTVVLSFTHYKSKMLSLSEQLMSKINQPNTDMPQCRENMCHIYDTLRNLSPKFLYCSWPQSLVYGFLNVHLRYFPHALSCPAHMSAHVKTVFYALSLLFFIWNKSP